ncbi:type II toxin-antitoxin system RelE/ParE family toxin [Rhizobium sp. CG5]|uniref:type II toxin-antitoxin system RelE/ParE family toxin n=1 Tax=Rhizobium sp. CG5 TaxID=2726076 RepID=UPI0020344C10|nr:type II toxin-antitoxin system RelE/ParE family toxin [Rhizobium sp. CG5]MCM2476925.1 type II toxin-antitoxin system RelE/ParE family toxin [Rhizobium sp. CG5]
MARYLFYPRADAAQDRIWKDTAEIWGEAQAIAYIHGLHAHLAKLAESRALWRRFPETMPISSQLKDKAYFSRYEKHYVFFRELPGGHIGVMSILHHRMDIPRRLANDLSAFDAKRNDDKAE